METSFTVPKNPAPCSTVSHPPSVAAAAAAACPVCPTAQLHAGLLSADRLLAQVSRMGPLMSLLKAHIVREEFLRINRDITATFNILAAGEQLLVRPYSRPDGASGLSMQCGSL